MAIGGDKGSPGVTTATLALASAWVGPAIAVEADPAGGDLAIRLRSDGSALPEGPTVLSVVTAARAKRDDYSVRAYVHAFNATTGVIPGAMYAEQMVNVGDWTPLAEALRQCQSDVFLDVGHLHSASPMLSLAARADLVIAVARPDLTSVVRLRDRLARLALDLAQLRGAAPRLLPVLVTTSRHGSADVADLRRIIEDTPAKPFVVGCGFLAHDASAVRRLQSGDEPAGRLSRTDLMRTARQVNEIIGSLVGLAPATDSALTAGGQQ
ncbi:MULTISPECIES: MinD/ParA family ATP-binding protein [unclassified Nocardioides]|uniref:MinD/ParA family ATP-binding protein n=1 Tax=unclassified Nocardioides TaxID=2615069 RepID=UPI0012E3A876|nr:MULTISPECIES: hypothetical protein [unclassified Nocardioides]